MKAWRVPSLIALTALLLLPAAAALAAGNSPACTDVRVWADATSVAGCDYADDSVDPVTRARTFIEAYSGAMKMPAPGADLVYLQTVQGLASRHVRFQQFLFGYPVYNGFVSVHENPQGHISRMHISAIQASLNAVPGRMIITQDGAVAIARQVLAQQSGGGPVGIAARLARQVWYPRADGQLVLAWEVLITADQPLLDYRVIVDRATGEVLLWQDRLVHWINSFGKAFWPNPIQTSADVTMTANNRTAQYISSFAHNADIVQLAEGTGKLIGRFVDVSQPSPNLPQSLYPIADEPSRQYFYDVADPRFLQVNAYNAIDSAQRYVRALGFSGDRTVPPGGNGIRNFPTIAYPSWDGADSSFFRPTTNTLHFGEGGVPDAQDSDIMVHEYGHAIQFDQNPSWGCTSGSQCDMTAMGEGFSDYLAAVVHASYGNPAYQDTNAACVGEWDSTAYRNLSPPFTYPPCLRRVDGNKIYPTDLIGEIHKDGEIWSRALWDIRNAIGGNVASQIVLEHHYSLPQGSTMPQAALEMISVDADLFGGFNEIPLRRAFCARGILTGADCVLPTNSTIIVPASKDALIREFNVNRNEGHSPLLRSKGEVGTTTRLLLGFDLSGIDLNQVKSAVLEMTIAATDQRWSPFGRTIDAHPLVTDFVEGNGVNVGADQSLKTFGSGVGATWNCPSDSDISNYVMDCASPWSGGSALGAPLPSGASTPPAVQTNVMTDGQLRWTVTSDVKAGLSRWIVKKTFEDKPGVVDFYSKEGALALDPYDTAGRRPRLIITFN